MDMNDKDLVVETADVKPCPHGFVFISKCYMCSGWINVKDRLPDKDGRYLVCEDHWSKWIGVCALRNGQWDESKVSHWMPLPEPPKSES